METLIKVSDFLSQWGFPIMIFGIMVVAVVRIVYVMIKNGGKLPKISRKQYGRAVGWVDPLTGLPRNVVDKPPIIEYIEEETTIGSYTPVNISGEMLDDDT
jgi:hypothetical protein